MNRLMNLVLSFVLAVVSIIGTIFAAQAFAGDVEIVKTRFEYRTGNWHVSTTLRHDDAGWEHYADAWRVVTEDGKELGTRTLFHPHEDEQPFTRGHTIQIPNDVNIVYVEAHDKVHGWNKQRVRVDLGKASGDRFTVNR